VRKARGPLGTRWHGAFPQAPHGSARTAPLLWLPRGAHRSRGFLVCGSAFGAAAASGTPRASTSRRRKRRRRIDAQGGHISAEARINERIRAPEVRLVGPKGEQIGIVSINDALKLAQEADLDLVEVAPTARPPVAKLMDYGKFKYEAAVKARESRKNQTQTIVKEIKLRPKIDPHDYGTKKGHVERFLKAGDKVKVTIMFRGREQSRPELGFRLLQRLAGDVEELGFVESQPKQDGRNMIMVIGPHRKKNETKAHTGQAHSKSVPSPRPAASDALGSTAASDALGSTAASDADGSRAAPAAVGSTAAPDASGRVATAAPEPAAPEPAADGAAVPGPA
jgi:translation initiation factor IF-3